MNKRISWFPRLRFCGRFRNLEFTITITILPQHRPTTHAASYPSVIYIYMALSYVQGYSGAGAEGDGVALLFV